MTTSPVSDLHILIAARAIISSSEHWTQDEYARTKEGKPCGISLGEQFCSIGAIRRAQQVLNVTRTGGDETKWSQLLSRACGEVFHTPPNMPMYVFNDDIRTTHDMVLRVFDRAIENLSANGGNNAGRSTLIQ